MPDRVPRSRDADRVKCRSQQMIAAGHAGGGRGGRSPLRLTDSDSPGARALFKGGSVTMKPIEMGIVGVGWIGEIRAKVCRSEERRVGKELSRQLWAAAGRKYTVHRRHRTWSEIDVLR